MKTLRAGVIDVFGEQPFSGNPLAVVEGADSLSESQMRAIAREFNQAETTFVLHSDRADRKLRSFTAAGIEVFGAGHNALGAWLWLAHRGDLGSLEVAATFRQEIGEEVLAITIDRHRGDIVGRMKQAPAKLLGVFPDTKALANALELKHEDLQMEPPPRVVHTGTAHLLVGAKSREAVDRARPHHERLLPLLKQVQAEGCYLFARGCAGKSDYAYARFFNPTVGLWEDAATGTAAGPLVAYLDAAGLLGAERTLCVEQGVKMGRRSLLNVRLTPEPELTGSGVIVLQGELAVRD